MVICRKCTYDRVRRDTLVVASRVPSLRKHPNDGCPRLLYPCVVQTWYRSARFNDELNHGSTLSQLDRSILGFYHSSSVDMKCRPTIFFRETRRVPVTLDVINSAQLEVYGSLRYE